MDDPLWFREDAVLTALRGALDEAVENGGYPAKAFAWDVWCDFRKALGSGSPNPDTLPGSEGEG